jgi:hypothetical protein
MEKKVRMGGVLRMDKVEGLRLFWTYSIHAARLRIYYTSAESCLVLNIFILKTGRGLCYTHTLKDEVLQPS